MAAPTSNVGYDFMYPDLLSKDGLVFILRQRYISHLQEDLESMDKEALVELYNRYILPLPQRTYRSNKRGQQMTRAQKLIDRKRKIRSADTGENNSAAKKSRVEGTSSGLINHHSSPLPLGDRLKPPPSCVNFERKRIKLNSASPSHAVKKDGDASTPKAASNETESQEVKGMQTSGKSNDSPMKKNSGTAVQEQQDPEAVSPKKKKFKPISWP